MKTKKELNALKKKIETVSKDLRELTEEELEQVTGGINLPTVGVNYKSNRDNSTSWKVIVQIS